MEILTKENLVGAKVAPTAISRTFTPLLKGNQVWGWKNDPEDMRAANLLLTIEILAISNPQP